MFNLVKEYSKKYKISTIGSEFLILAMFETKDSLCHFLLSDYECSHEEIEEVTNNMLILRKKDGDINLVLETIFSQAKILAGDLKIGDEHIFMSILMNKNSIACSILETLNLNIDELKALQRYKKRAKNNKLTCFFHSERKHLRDLSQRYKKRTKQRHTHLNIYSSASIILVA